jgi:hypothetical protein
MTRNIQLLKQVRAVTRSIDSTSNNLEHTALLSVADILLNELMLQDETGFYFDGVQQGRALLVEGRALATRLGIAVGVAPLQRELSVGYRIELLDAEIEMLFDALAAIVGMLDEGRLAAEKGWLSRVTLWESSLYQRSLKRIAANAEAETMTKTISRESLQAYLERKFPQ